MEVIGIGGVGGCEVLDCVGTRRRGGIGAVGHGYGLGDVEFMDGFLNGMIDSQKTCLEIIMRWVVGS